MRSSPTVDRGCPAATLAEAAERLRSAYTGGPIAPMRDLLDPFDGESAYRIQALNTDRWSAEGRRIVGRKVGLTSRAVQQQIGVDQPDFGVLFDDMEVADGGIVRRDRLLQPKAEGEIAIILAHDLDDPDVDAAAVARAVTWIAPAIEIVDSRIADWQISFADTVADNGSSACFILGDRVRAAGVDLYACGMVMEVNRAIASVGAGAACYDHPYNAAAWLARTLARQGVPLRAGNIVLTGALGPMADLPSMGRVRIMIGGIGQCTVEIE